MEDTFANCCTSCGEESETVEQRWSFGYYAGRICLRCAYKYKDHCGEDMPMGHPSDLDETPYINPHKVDL